MTTERGVKSRVVAEAHRLGFQSVRIVPAGPVDGREMFDVWIAEGRQANMGYMSKHGEIRFDTSKIVESAQTAILLTTSYHQPESKLRQGLRIARYARGDDYHDVLRQRMERLAAFVHAELGGELGYRVFVDSAPILERQLGQQGGLGWIGKNGMLIDPEHGSYFFLSQLLISTALEADRDERKPDRCGSCSACIDLCPTNALVAPYVLDARRCISYLTIEERGPIPRRLRPLMEDHLFGCDICQEACPWNRRAIRAGSEEFQARKALDAMDLSDLMQLSVSDYQTIFRRSPVKRTKRRGLLRNVAVAIGNSGDPAYLSLLEERMIREEEPLVRGHVAWAIGQIGGAGAKRILSNRCQTEASAYVLDEIYNAVARMEERV